MPEQNKKPRCLERECNHCTEIAFHIARCSRGGIDRKVLYGAECDYPFDDPDPEGYMTLGEKLDRQVERNN